MANIQELNISNVSPTVAIIISITTTAITGVILKFCEYLLDRWKTKVKIKENEQVEKQKYELDKQEQISEERDKFRHELSLEVRRIRDLLQEKEEEYNELQEKHNELIRKEIEMLGLRQKCTNPNCPVFSRHKK